MVAWQAFHHLALFTATKSFIKPELTEAVGEGRALLEDLWDLNLNPAPSWK